MQLRPPTVMAWKLTPSACIKVKPWVQVKLFERGFTLIPNRSGGPEEQKYQKVSADWAVITLLLTHVNVGCAEGDKEVGLHFHRLIIFCFKQP